MQNRLCSNDISKIEIPAEPGEVVAEKSDIEMKAEAMGVTVAKLQAMQHYAKLLAVQDKRMKPSTIRRKVCEKFKIQLT